jgi:Bacterial aa3 type cytochrome c oxidase subunit IV
MNYRNPKFHQTKGKKMAEHKHGSMNTKGHEYTFNTFIRFVVWGAGISIGILIFLALANG